MLVVRDDEELGVDEELLELVNEPADVRIVKSGVELVEHAERRWLDHEDREEKRDCRHRALAAGKQRHALRTLARRTRDDVDAALKRILGVLEQHKPRLAAAEEPREHRLEVCVRLLKRLLEHLARSEVQVVDERKYLRFRSEQVLFLGLLLRIALFKLATLVDCDHVDRPERGDLGLEPSHLGLELGMRWLNTILPRGIGLAKHSVGK